VVVGAGPGIGRACAVALGGAGADVVVAARDHDRLVALAAGVAAATGTTVVPLAADAGDLSSCRALVDAVLERFGRLDVLVNVATAGGALQRIDEVDGVAGVDELDQAGWATWRDAFEVNVIGTLELSRLAAGAMRARGGGSIVQIGTLGTHGLPPGRARYTSTKQAMVSASLTLAKEVGPWNVRVNVVTPGYVTGPPLDAMVREVAARTGESPEDTARRMARGAALRRHVDPEDVAEAVLFLAEPRARAITGIELPVTAGR
jgi:NAD(P)-dependent dehydrogenase (short-subunit alcohol dehydrogenase family)